MFRTETLFRHRRERACAMTYGELEKRLGWSSVVCGWSAVLLLALAVFFFLGSALNSDDPLHTGFISGLPVLLSALAPILVGVDLADRARKKLAPVRQAWERQFDNVEFLLKNVGEGMLSPTEREFVAQGWRELCTRSPIPRARVEAIGYVLKIGSLFIAEMIHEDKLAHGPLDGEWKTTVLVGRATFGEAERNCPLERFVVSGEMLTNLGLEVAATS